MKPSAEIGTGLALILIAANAVFSLAIGLENMATSWAILICTLLFNIWLRLIQIADALTSKSTGSTTSASADDFAPRSSRHGG